MNASFLSVHELPCTIFGAGTMEWLGAGGLFAAIVMSGLALFAWLTVRYIPNDSVGVVEKLWSSRGGVREGAIIALNGEAGYQADLLRGGIHFGYWRWQYRIHRTRLVTVPHGKIGYVYARDGEPLLPSQTLGHVVPSNNFQDARLFLAPSQEPGKKGARGQRGRQRAILREGVYALNTAVFVVITETVVYTLRRLQGRHEVESIESWHKELKALDGFSPIVVGEPLVAVDPLHPDQSHLVDSIGIVTIHDGPSLAPGEIIAPTVGSDPSEMTYHNNFQDAEAFLSAGGRRGRQHQPLTDGTYFINRWFATPQLIPKTVVPIGYVGVVVSYYGRAGRDLSGEAFRHGERVAEGERGVWQRPLGPGKYAFNTYAGSIVMVPTTNFVLHWITGKSESHRYDESLRSIDLVTRDAYEPSLPLSVVVHIDYMRAPSVIQRFGDVKRLITQTLDPMLSAYFRDIAHRKTMLELLHERDSIQGEARDELCRKFREFDIECVDVLIGKPTTGQEGGKIESLLEQLRMRQLSVEQLETYERQRAAAVELRLLNEAQTQAEIQPKLTAARAQAQIADSQGEADLARARKQAEQAVVQAEGELQRSKRQAQQTVMLAEAESQKQILTGRGESQRAMQVGLAEAAVLMRKVGSYGDPRLYALSRMSELLSESKQPLVPERVFVAGSNGDSNHLTPANGLVGTLLSLLVAEKSGFQIGDSNELSELKKLTDRLTHTAIQEMENENGNRNGKKVPEPVA
jgi:uncharacterized membrane protein YqiK